MDFSWIGDLNAWVALVTLVFLEIVLGIDNLIFLSIIISRLEASQRDKARVFGLMLAMLSRIALLISLFWVSKLTKPLFYIMDLAVSGRDIVLLLGGLFLIYKATSEIHQMTQTQEEHTPTPKYATFGLVLFQIMVLDIVFSLDSVITAVGMVDILSVMIIAIVVSVFVMLFASKGISHFIESNPSIKILALAFLILVGVTLVADSLHFHIPKGYIYFAIAFSLGVEMINIYLAKLRKKSH
ncbi:TerC family protein [Helicobacter sp. MIT 21-1697]|uniref:TerC family protein n=1 Tax=Helicobacter sp. MIT 21-1697 TaxID=2993733 RepID=UPI00224AB99C|nr:TerC family protein [Helicobacter sp. MIT 21-1697]MCX2716772.1 TerC family protein [Helicobacter sp. MIT 21-1697]